MDEILYMLRRKVDSFLRSPAEREPCRSGFKPETGNRKPETGMEALGGADMDGVAAQGSGD
jgi:hypothetical protein